MSTWRRTVVAMKRSRGDDAEDGVASSEPPASTAPPSGPELQQAQLWYYEDVEGNTQGPHASTEMRSWFVYGYMRVQTPVAPSYYGEVPVQFWPISSLWPTASTVSPGDAFKVAEELVVAAAAQTSYVGPDFIPSDRFHGRKPGYVFKADTDGFGTGYYRDQPPEIQVTADVLEEEAMERKRRLEHFKSNKPLQGCVPAYVRHTHTRTAPCLFPSID